MTMDIGMFLLQIGFQPIVPSLSLVGLFRGLVHQESTSSWMLDLLGFLVSFSLILFPYLP